MTATRAGKWVKQPEGYRAYIPKPLPPDPALGMDADLINLLSAADRALGRLDGIAAALPNPDLFVAMYVKHEAVLSSQIEGTQSTLDDVLVYEVDGVTADLPKDVAEVVNYVAAMRHGLDRLPSLPLSKRLLREVHAKLMHDVRGGEKTPGEFRRTQNWIGTPGSTLRTAEFVPPPPVAMEDALGDLEGFLNDRETFPPLVHVGLAHAQFETIHPFLDGNGRVGRLLIALLLCERGILRQPLLYLSIYLKAHRVQYYDRLTAIRTDGDWEGWIRFFLRGVLEVSESAAGTADSIVRLREEARKTVKSGNGQRLIDALFENPILGVRAAERALECSFVTAGKALEELEAAGLIREITGAKRNRRYRFDRYIELFDGPPLATSS